MTGSCRNGCAKKEHAVFGFFSEYCVFFDIHFLRFPLPCGGSGPCVREKAGTLDKGVSS